MRVFVTGATGYIGGDFLVAAIEAHPEWKIVCLVRDPQKGSKLVAAFPRIRVVHGDLDSVSTIEAEAAAANIVYHFAHSDHMKSAQAISRGLARSKHADAFWIHTSGAGILTHENFSRNSFGKALETDRKVYDDWDGIGELTSLPDKAIHRHVDKVVLSSSSGNPGRIKTAIVSPSCIYGVGRGTGNTVSVQVYVAARVALTGGKGLQVEDGDNTWHEVHIHDLSDLYVRLGEEAAKGGGHATWNERGYYLAENGSFMWKDVIADIAREGLRQGYLASADVESVDFEKAISFHRHFPYLCATTSRGLSKRAKILLGWKPSQQGLRSHISEIVMQEAAQLGLRSRNFSRSSL